MPETDDSAVHKQLKSVLVNFTSNKMAGMNFKDSILVTIRDVMEFVQEIIEGLEESGQSPAISCGPGCGFCCHSLIKIIPAEALLISSYISRHYTDTELLELKNKINNYRALIHGKNFEKRTLIKDQMPCIFLKEDNCSIYQVRPFICRAWNSIRKSDCQAAFQSGDHTVEIENSPARNFIFSTAREIFEDLDNELTHQTGHFELPGAVLSCLNQPDSLERWSRGENIFPSV